MDGFQATREIRKFEGSSSHVPIVALTANVMAGIADQCAQCGMDKCILYLGLYRYSFLAILH